MAVPCDNIERCAFFKEFCLGSEEIKSDWVRLFCGSEETSELCERKKYRLASGEDPPVNMSPTGRFL